jgi:hypothetical protein
MQTRSASPLPRKPRLRAWMWVVTAHLVALGLALVLFIAARLYVHHKTFASRTSFWLGDVYRYDAAIGFAMAPDRNGVVVLRDGIAEPARRVGVRTDANGFRIPLDGEPTGSETGGLVGIGCSCTFGYGVPAESTYVYLAAEQLGIPAHNLGVCSYSAVTSIELLRQHIGSLEPSIVVYGYGNFHLERSERPRTDGVLFQAYLVDEGGAARLVPPRFDNSLVFATVPRIEDLYYRPKLAGEDTPFGWSRLRALLPLAAEDLGRLRHRDYLRLRFETHDLPESTFARWVVRELAGITAAAGADAVLLFFPAFLGEKPSPEIVRAAEEIEHPGFQLVDVSPRLEAGTTDQDHYARRWQVPRDGHPNGAMHLEMARAVVEAVRADGSGTEESAPPPVAPQAAAGASGP